MKSEIFEEKIVTRDEVVVNYNWPLTTIFSYVLSAISLGIGLYKLFVYENSEYGSKINAYVGGDAYNYIINSNYATAYFVLALFFVTFGSLYAIILIMNSKKI